MGWLRRLGTTVFTSRRDRDFDEEAQFHLESRAEEYVRDGMTPEEAQRAARRRFGNLTLTRERTRDVDTHAWMRDLGYDLRHALRTLRRNPGFAVAAILTLALGIGANTAIFSATYGVLLRPLPYAEASRLVRISEFHQDAVSPLGDAVISDLTFDAWRAASRTIEGMAAYSERAYTVTGHGDAERIRAASVSPDLFSVLRVTPAAGRFFDRGEAVAGADRVVVLSHGYWQRRFGGRADAVGLTIVLDGSPRTIVGIAPAGFSFPDAERQMFTPFVQVPPSGEGASRRVNVFTAIGRLAPGATIAQAEAEGTAIARGLGPRPVAADLLFGKGGPVTVRARTIVGEMTAAIRPVLQLLAAGVALVLLLGCANVANLFLSLGVARERELAVRAAIGAGRGRLLRQLLAESLALSVFAAIAGIALAWWVIDAWPAIAPRRFPRMADVRLDWPPLLFAIVASIVAGALVGIAPAAHGSRVCILTGLREGAGGSIGSRSIRTRRGLLVFQAAFAVILLVGAALLLRSFERLTGRDAGFDADHVITAQVSLQGQPVTPVRWQQVSTELVERIRSLPSLEVAGAASMAPLGDSTRVLGFALSGDRPEPVIARALGYIVTPGYTQALRLRLKQGRLLQESDANPGPQAFLVNEEFVRIYLADGRPAIGRRYTNMLVTNGVSEIVGVVGNVLKSGLTSTVQPEIYVPLGNHGAVATGREIYVVMRTSRDAAALAASLRTLAQEIDPNAAVHSVRTLAGELSASAGESRFAATIVGMLAALAVGLAAIGLYGALTYSVSRRTRELGIRAALGASRAGLVALVVREGMGVTAAGLVLGLGAAVVATRGLRGILFEIDPLDVVSFASAPAILAIVALGACALPAWRATAVDATEALRRE